MNPTTGYYSIVQYCPDVARREVANVGVVLLCPELGFLETRMAPGAPRIKEVFPELRPDRKRLEIILLEIAGRLQIDRDHFMTVDALRRFAGTRANAMRLTDPLPVRVEDPTAELNRLFKELVGGRHRLAPNRVRQALARAFAKNEVSHLIREKVEVTLPVFGRPITAPFAFQTCLFNLIQATKFAGHAMLGILSRAGQFALQGELLAGTPHPKLGPLQLIVVAQFGPDQGDVFRAVHQILQEKGTRIYKLEEAAALAQEIRQTARPIDSSLFAV